MVDLSRPTPRALLAVMLLRGDHAAAGPEGDEPVGE
jgi:hypothetical protein